MKLPKFKFHPDPLSTGSFEVSKNKCKCCGRGRGVIYVGPIIVEVHEEQFEYNICPWCIADGSAHKKFDIEFTDPAAIGNHGEWDKAPEDQIEEIAFRTPGYYSWQESLWWTHCGEAAEFLGFAGKEDAERIGSNFLNVLRLDAGIEEDSDWIDYLNRLHKEDSPTAYIFRCRICGIYGGYSDSH